MNLAGEPFSPRILPHPYAFNLFSHDTPIDPATGYNDEETKVIAETRKIFGDPELRIGLRESCPVALPRKVTRALAPMRRCWP